MKTVAALKTELFEKLKKYPKIEEFFKDSLQERLKMDESWTENILVQNILDEKFTKDDKLLILIESISNDSENYKTLQKKLTPKDDYEQKTKDVLAELNGYCHLKKFGFSGIRALTETSSQKTPDFSAKLNNSDYLFEVKHMREPIDIVDILFDKINERKLLIPEVYENIKFDIKVSNSRGDIYFTGHDNETLKLKVLLWLNGLFYHIESSKGIETVTNKVFNCEFEDHKFSIEFNLEKDTHSVMVGSKRGFLIDSQYKKERLMPFIKKVIRIVDIGMIQLFEYDKTSKYSKYILVDWGIPRNFFFLDRKKLHDIIKDLGNLLEEALDDLHIRFLDFDNLP